VRHEERVTRSIALLCGRWLMHRPKGARSKWPTTLSSSAVAEAAGITTPDVGRVGRARRRLYFDFGDRQVRASYAAGCWTIRHRARYW
jgi:hypothetical protein